MNTNRLGYTVHNCLEDIVKQLVKRQQATVDVGSLDSPLLDDIEQKISEAVGQVILQPNHEPGATQGDYRVQNLSESLVDKILFEYLEEKKLLTLPTEQLDIIAAMVLNQVKPRYAVTGRGGAYKRLAGLELQFAPSIMVITNNVLKNLESKGVL